MRENRAVPSRIDTRRATLDDLDALLAHVQAGFDSYAEFASLGWQPPTVSAQRDRSAELLADPATWALIALAEGGPVGHVAFFPARARPTAEPPGSMESTTGGFGLAHLWQLFVLPRWWGRGVAPLLHDAMIAEMRARGYRDALLFTPALHARARRFYERRGWSAADEQFNDELGLMLTDYRLVLS